MKDLRQQIIEILQNNLYAGVLKNVYTKIADEILALPLYPKEFVEWIGLGIGFHDLGLREIDMKWIYPIEPIAFSDEFTLDELYSYWKFNIQDK